MIINICMVNLILLKGEILNKKISKILMIIAVIIVPIILGISFLAILYAKTEPDPVYSSVKINSIKVHDKSKRTTEYKATWEVNGKEKVIKKTYS